METRRKIILIRKPKQSGVPRQNKQVTLIIFGTKIYIFNTNTRSLGPLETEIIPDETEAYIHLARGRLIHKLFSL